MPSKLAEIVTRLNRLRPEALFGYPSMIARLAVDMFPPQKA